METQRYKQTLFMLVELTTHTHSHTHTRVHSVVSDLKTAELLCRSTRKFDNNILLTSKI